MGPSARARRRLVSKSPVRPSAAAQRRTTETCPPHQLREFMDWFHRLYRGTLTYLGIQSPEGTDQVWHQVTASGDITLAAEDKHIDAHRSTPTTVYHGATANRLVRILQFGGLENGAGDGEKSPTPFCCRGCDNFLQATKTSFGQQGCVVHLVVYGTRNNWDTIKGKRDVNKKEDWRQLFLDAEAGQFLAWQGNLWMKAEGTELRGFLIRDDVLDSLAKVSYARSHKRR